MLDGEQSGVVELLVGERRGYPAADFERAGRERIFSLEQDIRVEGFGEGFASDQGRSGRCCRMRCRARATVATVGGVRSWYGKSVVSSGESIGS